MKFSNYIPFVRQLSHSNSAKKIADRTKDDNQEASEYTNETFRNRKGGVKAVIDAYNDIFPDKPKHPVKPQKGMRKHKGDPSIRHNTLLAQTRESRKADIYDMFCNEGKSFLDISEELGMEESLVRDLFFEKEEELNHFEDR